MYTTSLPSSQLHSVRIKHASHRCPRAERPPLVPRPGSLRRAADSLALRARASQLPRRLRDEAASLLESRCSTRFDERRADVVELLPSALPAPDDEAPAPSVVPGLGGGWLRAEAPARCCCSAGGSSASSLGLHGLPERRLHGAATSSSCGELNLAVLDPAAQRVVGHRGLDGSRAASAAASCAAPPRSPCARTSARPTRRPGHASARA